MSGCKLPLVRHGRSCLSLPRVVCKLLLAMHSTGKTPTDFMKAAVRETGLHNGNVSIFAIRVRIPEVCLAIRLH
jgi:hypothetical protein